MSKKNTKVKRIFALLMAVLIAVTYMPNPLYAYAEDYMDDDQVTAPSDEYVEETPQDGRTIKLDGDLEVPSDSARKALIETEAEAAAEDADAPVSDDTAVDTETDDTEEPSGETSEGTVEDGREPLDDKVDLTEVTTDTESQVVTKETETEAETISYPSHFFKEEAGGVKVAVSAPEGALPEGTTMEVTPILAEDVEEAVSEAVSDKVKSINAVDITFKNAEGQEIEPLIPVTVTLNVPGMNRKATKEIVHIDDEGTATTVDYVPVANTGASLFESDQFSVYVVVETGEDARLAVNFVKADGSSVQMLITPNQISHIEQYIYDPGVGELPAGEIFEGWTQDPDYNASTTKKTIADVRQDVIAELQDGVTEGDSMTFYPMIFKSYTVTYLDEHSIKIKTDQMLVRADEDAPTYEVSESYTPYPTGEVGVVAEFIGWQQILPEVPGETVMLHNGDSFTMEESAYTLKAITQKGHWLMFEENLNNAPYTQPQFVALGGTAQEPANPVRTGYTFDGWWTADASSARDGQVAGERFNFSTPLTANTIVYAKWNKATQASYSVVIWQQNKEGTGYDYSGRTITVNNATVGNDT
ncbi:MAG: InlB B-repeat-containing protein, partial [Firmicutes bacterium]|nr:InlB B-repeat-containing protein [Bacillota bacterium]